jgi:hypothetical protein
MRHEYELSFLGIYICFSLLFMSQGTAGEDAAGWKKV